MGTTLGDPIHGDVSSSTGGGMRSSTVVLTGGVLVCLVAVALFVFPSFSSAAVTAITGWALLIGGALLAVTAFATHGAGRWTTALFGLLAAIAGVLLATNVLEGTATLTAIAIAWLIVDGTLGALSAASLRPPGWGVSLVVSLLGVALGVLLWANFPSTAEWVLGVYVGLLVLGRGLWLVVSGLQLRTAGE
jgi:uncharacterized membrane protein HdeD (DUF308 family)